MIKAIHFSFHSEFIKRHKQSNIPFDQHNTTSYALVIVAHYFYIKFVVKPTSHGSVLNPGFYWLQRESFESS